MLSTILVFAACAHPLFCLLPESLSKFKRCSLYAKCYLQKVHAKWRVTEYRCPESHIHGDVMLSSLTGLPVMSTTPVISTGFAVALMMVVRASVIDSYLKPIYIYIYTYTFV